MKAICKFAINTLLFGTTLLFCHLIFTSVSADSYSSLNSDKWRRSCPEPRIFPLKYSESSDYYNKPHTVFSVAYGLISTPFDCPHNTERYSKLRELMSHVDLQAVDPNGNTPAHVAVQYGLVKEIENLKSRGADLNRRNKRGLTPLGLAIVTFNFSTIKYLLENGACLDTKPVYWGEYTPVKALIFRTNRIKFLPEKIVENLNKVVAPEAIEKFSEECTEKLPKECAEEYVENIVTREIELLFLKLSSYAKRQILANSIRQLIKSRDWPTCTH